MYTFLLVIVLSTNVYNCCYYIPDVVCG